MVLVDVAPIAVAEPGLNGRDSAETAARALAVLVRARGLPAPDPSVSMSSCTVFVHACITYHGLSRTGGSVKKGVMRPLACGQPAML